MSSRAIRRLLQEEAKKQENEDEDVENEESDHEEAPSHSTPRAGNAFDMLNAIDEQETEEDHEEDDEPEDHTLDSGLQEDKGTDVSSKKKPKKKKKSKKKKNAPTEQDSDQGLDEIDKALRSLNTKGQGDNSRTTSHPQFTIDQGNAQLYRLLAVESRHLNALNEMKRLFGNVVEENDDADVTPSRRQGRGPQHLDLGTALTARYNPVSKGQGLKGLALKRNPFIVGKEEWPMATSGGLGMELVEKMDDGTVEYRFTHNTMYQDVQRQFELCVESMDPQRLISMLQFNPYHISTLLQVSEVAKQQGDHSVSGDLLERALFSFGRSAHSSFVTALSEGQARLDFRRPENREFWLAGWRYMNNLGRRGTWRTAYEWSKLILSLDPEGDPYCISNNIDQLALRSGQSEHFLSMAQNVPLFKDHTWTELPNILISAGLAQFRLKQATICRESLRQSVNDHPWVFVRLFQELSLPDIPKSIWGQTPRTAWEKYATELYALNAKDLWGTPEAVSLLVEVVETAPKASPPSASHDQDITLDDARVSVLSGVNSLINLIPRNYTAQPSTSYDPLPPTDNFPSYDMHLPAISHDPNLEAAYADLDPDVDEATVSTDEPNQADGGVPSGIQSRLTGMFAGMSSWLRSGSSNQTEPQSASEQQARQPNDLPANADGIEEAQWPQMPPEAAAQFDAWIEEAQNAPPEHLEAIGRMLERQAAQNGSDPASASPTADQQQLQSETAAAAPPVAELDGTSSASSDAQPANLQSYLAGTGLIRLRDFASAYKARGSHDARDGEWWASSAEGQRLLSEYASKLRQLSSSRMKEFLLKYTIPQTLGAGELGGAERGREAAKLIERHLRSG